MIKKVIGTTQNQKGNNIILKTQQDGQERGFINPNILSTNIVYSNMPRALTPLSQTGRFATMIVDQNVRYSPSDGDYHVTGMQDKSARMNLMLNKSESKARNTDSVGINIATQPFSVKECAQIKTQDHVIIDIECAKETNIPNDPQHMATFSVWHFPA